MVNAHFNIDGTIGVKFDRRTTTPEFELGTTAIGKSGRAWTYVQAAEAVATGTCTVSGAFALTDAAGSHTADTAFASGEYGWVYRTTSPF
jgi:hypothetical protein